MYDGLGSAGHGPRHVTPTTAAPATCAATWSRRSAGHPGEDGYPQATEGKAADAEGLPGFDRRGGTVGPVPVHPRLPGDSETSSPRSRPPARATGPRSGCCRLASASGTSSRQRESRRPGDDPRRVGPLGLAGVHRNDPPARGVEIGEEPEDRAVVVDEVVLGVEVIEQLDHLGLRGGQALVIQPIFPLGALADGDEQVLPVVGNAGAELPLLLIGTIVDQRVGRLLDRVVEDFLVVVGRLEFLAGLGVRRNGCSRSPGCPWSTRPR